MCTQSLLTKMYLFNFSTDFWIDQKKTLILAFSNAIRICKKNKLRIWGKSTNELGIRVKNKSGKVRLLLGALLLDFSILDFGNSNIRRMLKD